MLSMNSIRGEERVCYKIHIQKRALSLLKLRTTDLNRLTHPSEQSYNSVCHKKEWNNVICSNMDGPRDDHTKWSQTEKDKYYITYIWNLRTMIQMN